MAESDMSAPVTRGELRIELAALSSAFDEKLELWGGALLDRIERLQQQFIELLHHVQRQGTELERMQRHGLESEQRLMAEMARHANALQENVSAQIKVVDEKYASLPDRVTRLERRAGKPRRP